MAANVPAVVVPQLPDRNPFYQALAWIGFGTEGHCNSINNGGGLEAFDDFVGLTEINIRYMASSFSKRTNAQVYINFGMRKATKTWPSCTGRKMRASTLAWHP